MAADEILKEIVANGNNLVLNRPLPDGFLKELVILAKETGSKITVRTLISPELIRELLAIKDNKITFVESIDLHI